MAGWPTTGTGGCWPWAGSASRWPCRASYPFIGSIAALLGLAVLEAAGVALALPSAQSLLTQTVGPADYGQAQGLFLTGQTAMTALSAVAAGALFAVGPAVPFVVMACVCAGLVVAAAVAWAPVGGRVVPATAGVPAEPMPVTAA